MLLNGHLRAITGGLWHAPNPSLVWFWLIVALIACLLAAWRLPRPELHARLARVLAVVVLIALAVGGVGRELHGRPSVSIEQLVLTVILLAFAVWGAGRALRDRVGFVLDLVIGFVVLWMGFELSRHSCTASCSRRCRRSWRGPRRCSASAAASG